jgi:fructose-1,6-bisphosphatase I
MISLSTAVRRMSIEAIPTDCMTLTRWILREAKEKSRSENVTGELTQLLSSIQTAVKAMSAAVRRAGISDLFGVAGNTNVQGEEVKKLDILANDLFINMLRSSYACCMMVSEENENVIEVDAEHQGKYIVTFDPLDGSSNIDCLVSIGTIFAIFKKQHPGPPGKADALQSGRNIVAAGYALYGSATMLVLSTGEGVQGFMLDPSLGEFLLTEPDMKCPPRGSIYSVNEGYEESWEEGVREYLKEKKRGKPYSARYIGSMVADVHRTLKYGGIFMYPATKSNTMGKLRVLYEGMPMAFLMEQAGGAATDGRQPILDIVPSGLHDRSPVFMGSTQDVGELSKFTNKNNEN